MGVNVVCPGLRVGGADGNISPRFEFASTPTAAPAPGPTLWDLDPPGGGPGGGGGRGILRFQLPDGIMGDSSIGVRVS